tara:strand:+ start:131 stop:466 length:336 start_codon:yes stop_codon:yes gene_type:complete
MLRTAEEVVSYDYMIDEARGRVLVTVQLLPREKREQTVRIKGSDVRTMLAEKNIIVGRALSGKSIHNNMDLDIGYRSERDLTTDWVFVLQEITKEKPKPKKPVSKRKRKKS